MRSKEDAADYRYFPDPDLLPLEVTPQWVERVRAQLPELPDAMRERLVRAYGLSTQDAAALTVSRALAQYFEQVAQAVTDKKAAANWIMGEVCAALNANNVEVEHCPVAATELATLITRVTDGTVNLKTAKDIFALLWLREATSVDAAIEARGLKQISDPTTIERLVDEVLAANPAVVAEFRGGKQKAFQSLVGQAMKVARGKANPQQLNEVLRRKLGA
jgi:aspartyl-tRNA(Asn)/glutamyl-tRNA(Gln) amidotransferase subunit B